MKLKDLFKKRKNKDNVNFVYPSEVRKIKSYNKRVEILRNYFVK